MAGRSTRWRRSSPASTPATASSGFTLVELLVAMAVAAILLALVLPLVLSNRRLVEFDQSRTSTNQSLRSALDLIGADLRVAGEHLGSGSGHALAPLEVLYLEGAPDELVVRRNVFEVTLPVCQSGVNGSVVKVASQGAGTFPHCQVLSTVGDGADEWPANLWAWRQHRLARGGSLRAYIFNPLTGAGEFFTYDGEDRGSMQLHVAAPHDWQHGYAWHADTASNSRIYLIEERRYRVREGVLELIVNAAEAEPLRIADGIEEFEVREVLQGGVPAEGVPAAQRWAQLQSVEVMLGGTVTSREGPRARALTSSFFPRNVLSQ